MPHPDTIERYISTVERGDTLGALREFYAGHATQQENESQPRTGLDALLAHEKAMLAQTSGLTIRCLRPVMTNADHVTIRWYLRYRRADGKPLQLDELALQRWEGELIVREKFVYDPSQLKPQPGGPVTLREALASDLPAIQRIRAAVKENRLVSRRIGDAEVLQHMTELGKGWVAEQDGAVIGFAIGNARNGNIWALFVDPPMEGRGAARLLHDAMVTWLFDKGLPRLHLGTDPGTRAETFYRRAGWQALGIEHGEQQFELLKPA